jgi:hypothetical protein
MHISADRSGYDANAHSPYGASWVKELLKMISSPEKEVGSDTAIKIPASPSKIERAD